MKSANCALASSVMAVIGTGGMGVSIARRCGLGKTVFLGDFDETRMEAVAQSMRGEGYAVETMHVDVRDRTSVRAFAEQATGTGSVREVVHTAGLSSAQAAPQEILEVDLLGTALVLDEFGKVVASGGAGVFIASMAGFLIPPLPAEVEQSLANTPSDELLSLPFLKSQAVQSGGGAYCVSKRANQLRVRAMAPVWGDNGARVNSISPGVISTPMGQQELADPGGGEILRNFIEASGAKRIGTPEDIAVATGFLISQDASFITGIDILVDGGAIAALHAGRVNVDIS